MEVSEKQHQEKTCFPKTKHDLNVRVKALGKRVGKFYVTFYYVREIWAFCSHMNTDSQRIGNNTEWAGKGKEYR